MTRRVYYHFAQLLIRGAAHVLFGYEARGVEHVPPRGGFLLAANHKSYLDPPLLGACLRRELRYFAKRQLFQVPLLAPLIRAYGAVPVDREGADRRAVAGALEILASGQGLLVFPEGTRIRRPGLGEVKAGLGLLALRSGVPVVPAFIASSWEPRRRFLRRVPVRIRIGHPMTFESLDPGRGDRGRYEVVTRSVMEAIRTLDPECGGSNPPELGDSPES